MRIRPLNIFIIVCALMLQAACTSTPRPPASAPPATTQAEDHRAELDALLASADAAWEERSEAAVLQRALTAWKEALAGHAEHDVFDQAELLDIYLNIARAYAFAARTALVDAPAAADGADAARQGEEAARRALALAPESAEARFWLARNLELGARAQGIAAHLERAPEINVLADELAANPPSDLAPHIELMLARRACGADFGRSIEACAKHIDNAAGLAPDLLEIDLARAALLAVARDDRASFEQHLRELKSLPTDALSPEEKLTRREAAALLEHADDYFGSPAP